MTIHQKLASASPPGDAALTIGVFDGVHQGHQKLLQALKTVAASRGLLSAVVTFRNHPRLVLNPGAKLSYITPVEERLDLIKSQGVDLVIPVDFTREVSLIKAPEFVALLSEHLKMKGLLVGPDFALGNSREGDVPTLKRYGSEMGFWLETVEPVHMGGSEIKSTDIRSLITAGDVEAAARMLGRWYSLGGVVVEGDRRGRLMGFPTANLSWDYDLTIPADGIYATWATVDSRRYQAATCVGVRPTFGTSQRTVEAFILDFQGDLYGIPLRLDFVSHLREERTFPSVEALIEQMKHDVEQTRAVLSSAYVDSTNEMRSRIVQER